MSSLDFVADVIAGLRAEGVLCELPDVFGKGCAETSRRMGQDEQEEGSRHYVKCFIFYVLGYRYCMFIIVCTIVRARK